MTTPTPIQSRQSNLNRDLLKSACVLVLADSCGFDFHTSGETYRRCYYRLHGTLPDLRSLESATNFVRYESGLCYPNTFNPATLEADTLRAARLFLAAR